MSGVDATKTPEEHMRAMIADRLNEYQVHHGSAAGLLARSDDPSDCGCRPEPDEDPCDCPESDWDRDQLIAAAAVHARLAQAAAEAMTAMTAFWAANR